MTRDTVIGETLAYAATVSMVTASPLRRIDFLAVFFNTLSLAQLAIAEALPDRPLQSDDEDFPYVTDNEGARRQCA